MTSATVAGDTEAARGETRPFGAATGRVYQAAASGL